MPFAASSPGILTRGAVPSEALAQVPASLSPALRSTGVSLNPSRTCSSGPGRCCGCSLEWYRQGSREVGILGGGGGPQCSEEEICLRGRSWWAEGRRRTGFSQSCPGQGEGLLSLFEDSPTYSLSPVPGVSHTACAWPWHSVLLSFFFGERRWFLSTGFLCIAQASLDLLCRPGWP